MFYLPNAIVDDAASKSVFDGETGWIRQVERDHAVIHMAAEIDADGDSALLAEIATDADVEERIALQHEVIDPLRRALCLHESDRVMARVAMQEREAEPATGKADLGEIGHAESEQVAIKAERFIEAMRGQHHVAETHLASLEPGDRAAGMKGHGVDRAATENLGAHAAWIDAMDQIDYAAAIGLIPGTGGDFHAAVLQLLGDAVQSHLVRHFPPGEIKILA